MASQVAKKKKTVRKATTKKATRASSKKATKARKATKSRKAGGTTAKKAKAGKSRKKVAKTSSSKASTSKKSKSKTSTRKVKAASVKGADSATRDVESTKDAVEVAAKNTAKKSSAASKTPRTPTVPRTVKPAPKFADLEMDPEVLRFIDAIDAYKQEYSRPFPSWREVYYIFKQLGYDLAD